ncbi:unnamed protein product [Boreogadus saida]
MQEISLSSCGDSWFNLLHSDDSMCQQVCSLTQPQSPSDSARESDRVQQQRDAEGELSLAETDSDCEVNRDLSSCSLLELSQDPSPTLTGRDRTM